MRSPRPPAPRPAHTKGRTGGPGPLCGQSELLRRAARSRCTSQTAPFGLSPREAAPRARRLHHAFVGGTAAPSAAPQPALPRPARPAGPRRAAPGPGRRADPDGRGAARRCPPPAPSPRSAPRYLLIFCAKARRSAMARSALGAGNGRRNARRRRAPARRCRPGSPPGAGRARPLLPLLAARRRCSQIYGARRTHCPRAGAAAAQCRQRPQPRRRPRAGAASFPGGLSRAVAVVKAERCDASLSFRTAGFGCWEQRETGVSR